MKPETAITLLLKACGLTIDAEKHNKVAADIVTLLYYLPLAIDQAGAYINTGKCNIDKYIAIYNKYRSKLMTNKKFRGASKYNRTVYGTWEISFQRIEEMANDDDDEDLAMASKHAINLIYICAFFHHDNISGEIFERAAIHYADHVEDYSDSPVPSLLPLIDKSLLNIDSECDEYNDHLFMESIDLLLSYSLIRINQNGYSFHPLVQSWCKDRLSLDDRRKWILNGRAVLISSASQNRSQQEFMYQQYLVPHIIRNINEGKEAATTIYYHDVASIFGHILHANGHYQVVEDLRLGSVNAHEKILGPDHRDTVNSVANLASIYLNTAKWVDAERLLTQVIDNLSRDRGDEHPDTLRSMADLAAAYMYQGKSSDAEPLQTHILELRMKTLGPDHPLTRSISANLALTYVNLGKWAEAETMLTQVVEKSSQTMGTIHPDTLRHMSNLATTYWKQGKLEDAEGLQEHIMETRIQILGEEHPDTLTSISNLSTTYVGRDKLDDARKLQERALELRTKVLGATHPHTLNVMTSLSITYRRQGNLDASEMLAMLVLDLSMQVLGLEHPDTVSAMENLSETYKKQDKWEDAAKLLIPALKIRIKTVGENHPDTLNGMMSFFEIMTHDSSSEKRDVTE